MLQTVDWNTGKRIEKMEMRAIDALINRVSCGLLTDPAPEGKTLEWICRAALRTADHARLRPWRYLIVEGDARHRLGELFVKSLRSREESPTDSQCEKAASKPLRAPMIIVCIARRIEHAGVPEIEQVISTGGAVQNMLVAAHALGVGAMWRTGSFAYCREVKEGLGLAQNERIVGFLYLGSPKIPPKAPPRLNPEDYFTRWPG